jgi:hypothetical protein
MNVCQSQNLIFITTFHKGGKITYFPVVRYSGDEGTDVVQFELGPEHSIGRQF